MVFIYICCGSDIFNFMSKHRTSLKEDLETIGQSKQGFLDEIDRMAFCHKISSNQVKLARIKVNHAEAIITGRPMDGQKELSKDALKSILQYLTQIIDGTRQTMVLQLNEDHSGLTDLVSKKHFMFRDGGK